MAYGNGKELTPYKKISKAFKIKSLRDFI